MSAEQGKKDIFTSELKQLHIHQYITTAEHDHVLHAYHTFYEDKKITSDASIKLANQKERKESSPKKQKEKKVRTAEQLRERNIGFLLYIGVLLLLIGGLFVATSNWDSMTGWMKAGSIFFVSFLFYGFAVFAKKIVKIEKTAFAFFVLGSFFLPIGILSVSWFELLGNYLSFEGEGNYLLGVIGTACLIPIYYYLANLLLSRFFRVVTLATISCMAAFFLLSLHVSENLFFFFFIGYNSLLIIILSKWKEKKWVKRFGRELPIYTQIHLVLTTICLSIFYGGAILHGINFLLLSVLYFGILYETKFKQYHVFVTLMFVIGCYRIFTTDLFYNWSPLLFACVVLIILMFGSVLKGSISWGKTWEITSVVVIVLTFVYSQSFNMGIISQGSIVIAITYLLIACQFTYLVYKLEVKILKYLPAVFIGFSLCQVALKYDVITSFQSALITLYSIGFVLFALLGFYNRIKIFKKIKYSSATIGLGMMICFALVSGIFYLGKWYVGCLFLLLGFSFILVKKEGWSVFYLSVLRYLIPLCFAAAYFAFGESFSFLGNKGMAFNIAVSSVILLATKTFFFKNDLVLKRNSFLIGQGLYIIAIFVSLTYPVYGDWTRTCIYAVGILVFIAFYQARKDELVAWLISIVATMTYFACISDIFAQSESMQMKWHTYGWVVLFVLRWMVKEQLFKRPFIILAHVYLLISISVDYVTNGNGMYMHFLYALCAYLISLFIVKSNWMKILFQYACYCCFFLFFANTIQKDVAGGGAFSQAFLLTSILLFIVYVLFQKLNKEAVIYFFIPLSIIGIGCWIITSAFSTTAYIVVLCYISIYLLLMYISKKHYFSIAGLIMLVAGTERLVYSINMMAMDQFLLYSVIGVLLVFIGSCAYKTVYNREGAYLDFYSFTSIVIFVYLYSFNIDFVWGKILPGLFISVTLFIQKGRVPQKIAWVPVLAAVVYLLQPYYAIIEQLSIPYYFSKESIVLPWVLMVIISKKIVKGNYIHIINKVEWGILLLVSYFLIIDALQTATITDAIIVGSLSVLSVICGFYYKYKSYFFIGIIVLLLNVMLQTRPYWGNFPWWAYLLIAGSVLIIVASFYEMQKQKSGGKFMLKVTEWKNKIRKSLSRWQ
ncbi:hypothetical protein [Niallia sp. 01092]|uniref:hypothetical protein n=1 Tax=unclassified Niallia TaxID=2837522 RepID=UPI003FD0B61C